MSDKDLEHVLNGFLAGCFVGGLYMLAWQLVGLTVPYSIIAFLVGIMLVATVFNSDRVNRRRH